MDLLCHSDVCRFVAVKRKLTASTVRGKDYKRLLEKVEGREEKTRKVRETDAAAGDKLKEKHLWQVGTFLLTSVSV